ncbi:MAG: GspE/PulE family protein [Gammaproteobacteria bacterium]|nr:GspE/PulE family protein [Gammaproteobacteria bacterium]MDH5800259.1 GspE/PulE family protein [Gammaproteobacteria bacterium]
MGNAQRKPTQRIRLGDLLVEHKLISETQLAAALDEQKKSGRKLGRVLVESGYVNEDMLMNLLSTQLDLPYLDLTTYTFQPAVSQTMPETLARRYRVLVLEQTPKGYVVAMADPTNIFTYDEVVRVLKKPIDVVVVKESDLVLGIDKVYQRESDIKNLASELDEELSENVFDITTMEQSVGISEAPVVKLIQTLFEEAAKIHVSDIHIEPDEDVLRIRRRIDGVLHEQVMDEKRIATALVSRLKLMAGLDISEKRLPQDGRFNLKLKQKSIDVRLSTLPISTGEAVVMRLLDQQGLVLRLNNIGLTPVVQQRFRKAIHKPHGLLLVTGPTGSGKTSTLYAVLNELNAPEKKIITVEDPVEFQLPRINQVQVNSKIGLDFARVLRSSLRQDPDVILIGEIRDKETAEIALKAAITGHLVLSTLHTNDAAGAAMRLIDMGMESFMVSSALHAVLSQRLVRKVCDQCAEDYIPSALERSWLEQHGVLMETEVIGKKGKGCSACSFSGYQGRIAVHEFLQITGGLAETLRLGDYTRFIQQTHEDPAYESLLQRAVHLMQEGVTSLEEVVRIAGWVD